ncbi:MAG: carbon-nitrogen hydrolase family protein [Chloroflexi bacterium]|jgi:predicted amidohydrolase|nr:MAG: carbon-nitrogen hydrolase family protein [Chloroflexota bacterium]
MRVGLVQINSQEDRHRNVARAIELIDQAVAQGAQLVALPECVTFLGRKEHHAANAETLDGETAQAFAATAKRHGIWLHGGSIIEQTGQGKDYNTTIMFNPQGQMVATYRKIHLFDVDIAPGSYRESDTYLPGTDVVTTDVDGITLGLTICYDMRFPELYRTLALAGAKIIAVPAAFTAFTGKDHWEVLLRARAIENQCYIIAPAQWGEHPVGRQCYGRSMIINPWGTVIAQAPDGEGVVVATLDMAELERLRKSVPSLANRRPATYRV